MKFCPEFRRECALKVCQEAEGCGAVVVFDVPPAKDFFCAPGEEMTMNKWHDCPRCGVECNCPYDDCACPCEDAAFELLDDDRA